MIISRKNPLTGATVQKVLDITDAQMQQWKSGTPIQIAFPHLSPGDREFILTGCCAGDWEKIFGEDK